MIHSSENDILACVTKRKISGGTMSTAGRTARDVMLGLMKTCNKLDVSISRCLGNPRLSQAPSPSRHFQASSVRPQTRPDRPGICPGYRRV